MRTPILVFIAALLSSCQAGPLHRLRQHPGVDGNHLAGLDCLSWRLGVETHNVRDWRLVPKSCENYVGNYMLGKQYRHDCRLVADEAVEYAESLNVTGDGKDIWVFDIDETALSNLPYYARSDVQFGALPYNSTRFDEWVAEAKTPAVPAIRYLYKKVVSLGFKTAFLTGTAEKLRDARVANLKTAGYRSWEKLILKGDGDKGLSGVAYKSKKRTEMVREGFRIAGNVGDQWSDLVGENGGMRTFKVPDPMYYIP